MEFERPYWFMWRRQQRSVLIVGLLSALKLHGSKLFTAACKCFLRLGPAPVSMLYALVYCFSAGTLDMNHSPGACLSSLFRSLKVFVCLLLDLHCDSDLQPVQSEWKDGWYMQQKGASSEGYRGVQSFGRGSGAHFNLVSFKICTFNIYIINCLLLRNPVILLFSLQMDLRRMGALYQNLRQPRFSDPNCSLCAGPAWWHQPLHSQQILYRREARESTALWQSTLSCPVEDRSLVRGIHWMHISLAQVIS